MAHLRFLYQILHPSHLLPIWLFFTDGVILGAVKCIGDAASQK